MSDYPKFPKIPRWNKDVVLTEKVDGTNALIEITKGVWGVTARTAGSVAIPSEGDEYYVVRAGSRTRWITPQEDNHGFATWVDDHAEELVELGEGRHYGEWFGSKIQRGYGLDEKRFALFNLARWHDLRHQNIEVDEVEQYFPKSSQAPDCCTTVIPVCWTDANDLPGAIAELEGVLKVYGSSQVPGFPEPEGLVIWHAAAGQYFKHIFGSDEPKSLQEAA